MKRSTLLSFTLGLAALGLIDAIYLTETALTGGTLACSIQGLDGCNVVAKSAYSYLFGIPLAAYGVFFYGVTLVLALVAYYRTNRLLVTLLALSSTVGLLASIAFIYIQVVLIQALCVYCLGSAVISLLLFGTIFVLFRRSKEKKPFILASEAEILGA